MSSSTSPQSRPLVSQLLQEDTDLRDIVEEFVQELVVRVDELQKAHEKHDWDMLSVLAHRLKGAAGSYGYPEISQLCAKMEQGFRAQQADEFDAWIQELNGMTSAAQEGLSRFP